MKENGLTINSNTIIRNYGLAVRAPSSGILSEIFLQYIEALHITHKTKQKKKQDHKLFPLCR